MTNSYNVQLRPVPGFRKLFGPGSLRGMGAMLFALFILFGSSSSAQVCCPEFELKDAVEICPPENACPGGSTGGLHTTMVACQQTYHQYTVYPNNPMYTYTWTITGGTPATFTGNPVTVLWGSGASGTIKVVISGGGCLDSLRQDICLIKGPSANFTMSDDTVCLNTPVVFTNSSTGASDFLWDFGDGTISTLATPPPHSYASPGTYTVTLTAFTSGGGQGADGKRPCGCRDTITRQIVVLAGTGPVISHDCCYGTVCPGDTTSLCTPVVCSTYNWTVSGGTIISGAGTNCIKVKWNLTYSGPTTVTLSVPGCGSAPCPGSATISVPVLYPNIPITGPNVLCVGETGSYSLPSLPGTYYQWTTTAPLGTYSFTDYNRNTPTIGINFLFPGTYQIQCQYQNPLSGCSGVSIITVDVRPIFNFNGDDVVCQGDPYIYTANGNANWSVTPSTGVSIIPVTGTSTTVTFGLPGTYTLTATTTTPLSFCNTTYSKVVEVVAKPILGLISGPGTICPNSNQIYSITSNTPGSPFVWSITAGTGSIITQIGPDRDVVIVKLTGTGPWQLSVFQQIEISPGVFCQSLPQTMLVGAYSPPVVTGPLSVCVDGITTYTASGAVPPGGIQWSVSPANRGSILTGQGSSSVTIQWHGPPAVATVTASHCGGSGSVNVNISTPPVVAAISASGPMQYCLPAMPNNLTLSTTSGFPSYQWSNSSGPIAGATNASYTIPNSYFTGAGIYYFWVTVSNGSCSVTKSTYVLIGNCGGGGTPPNPVVCSVDFTINPNPACVGQPVTYTALPTGPGFQFAWDFGDPNSTSFQTPTQHTYVSSGTYTVTLTATLGTCVAVKTHTVTVNPAPNCVITASDTMYCPGSTVTLTACPGMSTYQWYLNGSAISGATSSIYAAGNYGNYSCLVTNSFGCSAKSNSIFIYEKPTPIARITGDGSVCAYPATITGFSLSAFYDPNYIYSWTSSDPGATFTPNGTNASSNTYAMLTLPGTLPYTASFILQVTDVTTGCSSFDTLCVIFSEIPTITVPFYYGCQNGPVTLTPSVINPVQYAYQWSHGQTTPVVTVSAAGSYSLTITDKVTGCSATTSAAFIAPLPNLSLFPLGCKTIDCKTDTMNLYIPLPLTQNPPFNSYASAYPVINWYANGNYASPIGSGNNFPFVVGGAGTFQISVVVQNAYGCTDTAGVFCLTVKCDTLDFGDAPDSPNNPNDYPTLFASNGARHVVIPGIFLGSFVDKEADGQPSIGADCDDNDCIYTSLGDDEDGVTMPNLIKIGSTVSINVQASVNGFLDLWIDFNVDGDWADAGEHVFTTLAVFAGPNPLSFVVPGTATIGQSYARYRFRTLQNVISYDGLVTNGEVEDYPVFIDECSQGDDMDYGDAPEGPNMPGFNYPTLLSSNGARHVRYLNIRLGSLIDPETNGQPNIPATGDDLNTTDDEDGVVFIGKMYVGKTANIQVNASINGFLNAWMDFNKDGDWADAGEQIFTNQPLNAGVNNLSFNIPSTALQGKTYMRFRFNTTGGLTYFGAAVNGEVEDYNVHACPKWVVIPSLIRHLIFIPHNLPGLTPGDVLGVFYTDNNGLEQSAGITEFNGTSDQVMVVYGDNPATPVKDGFAVGEPIVWKLCSYVKGDANTITAVYDPTFPNYSGVFAVNGLSGIMAIFGLHIDATAAPASICSGEPVELGATTMEPVSGVTWSWTSNPAGFYSNEQYPVDYPTTNTVYTVEAFDGVFHAYDQVTVNVTEVNPLVESLPLRFVNIADGVSKCYNATLKITTAGAPATFVVQNGGHAELISGQRIFMMPGTKVNPGGYLRAHITTSGQYCCAVPDASMSLLQGQASGLFDKDKDASMFRVYPNPTSGEFTLSLNGDAAGSKVTVEIYGLLGERIKQFESDHFTETVFDLSQNAPGVYLIRVQYDGKTGFAKVIRQ